MSSATPPTASEQAGGELGSGPVRRAHESAPNRNALETLASGVQRVRVTTAGHPDRVAERETAAQPA